MAVEKMKFINIVGPIKELDSFVSSHIIGRDIELLNSMSILDDVKGIMPYLDENPYTHLVKSSREAMNKLGFEVNDKDIKKYDDYCIFDLETIEEYMDEFNKKLTEWDVYKKNITEQINKKEKIRKQLLILKDLDVRIDRFFHFEFIKFRFGYLPKINYEKLEHYTENVDVIVIHVFEEEDNVYIMYFSPEEYHEKVDSLFSSLYFKRIYISGEVQGYPKDALLKIDEEIEGLKRKLVDVQKLIDDYGKDHIDKLKSIYYGASKSYQVFHVRKYAAHSKEVFCIHGWISKSELSNLKKELDKLDTISYVIEDPEEVPNLKPPTKLRNNPIFRPFQELVNMYGIPSYNEFDPTPLIALTYMLLFGMMFGDVGQGLILALLGFIFTKKTGNNLGKIISLAGLSSTLFGFVYGSIFGIEELNGTRLPHLISPMEEQYLILGIGIGLGVVLIIVAIIISIYNSFKNKNIGKALFDKNGLIGLVLYIAILGIIGGIATQSKFYANPLYVLAFIIVPLFVLFLSHPIINYVNSKRAKRFLPDDKGSFFVEAFFEVFEILLSIVSNTLSFVRVGAFALNHVGLFMAVHVLADMSAGVGGVIVNLLGNILIIGLEGLIVGIQGLRLEYYELFSRFFEGEGRELKPFTIKYDTEV